MKQVLPRFGSPQRPAPDSSRVDQLFSYLSLSLLEELSASELLSAVRGSESSFAEPKTVPCESIELSNRPALVLDVTVGLGPALYEIRLGSWHKTYHE